MLLLCFCGVCFFFSDFLYKSLCCWDSFELPHQGNSNEYQQHISSKEVDKSTLAVI